MKVVLSFDGRADVNGSALLCHNERLADPLDPAKRAVSEIADKRKKTEAEHLELARREFLGGLYTNGNGPMIPAANMLRCIEDGARRVRRGKDVNRGIVPLVEHADLIYDGPRDPDELWTAGFWLRKGVGVGTKRVIRTRPCFNDWRLELPIEVDPDIWDLHSLQEVCALAGKYAGLGDMRPIQGRCQITAMPIDEWLTLSKGDTDAVLVAVKTQIQRIRDEHGERLVNHVGKSKSKSKSKSTRG